MLTSQWLECGSIYTRGALRGMFGIEDATINNGIFRPRGHNSIWLFVTEKKSADRTQYMDKLEGDILYADGQTAGRTDKLIIEHQVNDLEILVFYRTDKNEFPNGGFRYEGVFRYRSHTGNNPKQFVYERVCLAS